jgi:hypothetical protein
MSGYVQSTSTRAVYTLGSVQTPLAFLSNNTAGNTLIAAIAYSLDTSTLPAFSASLFDSQGNVWQKIQDVILSPGFFNHVQLVTYMAQNCKAGANTVTYNNSAAVPSGSFQGIVGMAILEETGLGTAPILQGVSHTTWNGGFNPPDQVSSVIDSHGMAITSTVPLHLLANAPFSIYSLLDISGNSSDLLLEISTMTLQGISPPVAPTIMPSSLGTFQIREFQPATPYVNGIIVFDLFIPGAPPPPPNPTTSELLKAQCFGFSIPSTSQVLSNTVTVNGKQSSLAADSFLTIAQIGGTFTQNFQLPLTDGSITFAVPGSFTATEVNDPSFGFSIQAFATTVATTFDISGVTVKICFSPPLTGQFDYIKTFSMLDGTDLTLALDNMGIFWQENVQLTPNVLTPFYTSIEPNTFAVSVTQDDREFIALSDLLMGTDMPRTYNGKWLDRLSQVGPGVAPSFSFTTSSFAVSPAPTGITQPAAVLNTGSGVPIRAINWSSAPGIKYVAGNVITLEYSLSPSNPPDPNLVPGGGVVLSGFPLYHGKDPNGSYLISSVQIINTGNGTQNSFSVISQTSNSAYQTPPIGAGYQASLATITLTDPAPGVQVGTQIAVSGATPPGWNSTWTITKALNAALLNVTATSLSSGVASYNFVLVSGALPAVGEQVTVTGTTNGNGIFNVVNGVISAVSPSSFSLNISSPDIASAAESGSAIINGTVFQFDPGPARIAQGLSPIIGNGGGGTIVQPGNLGSGTRMGTVMFLTRNGLLTAPAPPATFTLNQGANALIVTNIPIGPPNVIARVIALTGANGAFFFWLPTPVTVTSNGQQVTYDSTVIHDNTTTQATFNLTDAVLLAGLSIDAQGSNNFAQVELGSSIGVIAYAGRIFAWGEQNKVQNFNNLSFDGGYVQLNPSSAIEPAGWTVDAVNGAGGELIISPLFGDSYYIKNSTGSSQAAYGMIWQTAFQDYNNVAIITPQTQYSVRVTASSPSRAASGNLVIDLFSPSFNTVYGSFRVPLASMSPNMKIFTGTLLTTAFTGQVPKDLELRVWAENIPNNGDVEIDRLEPFDSSQPTLVTNMRASYFDNFEAFDGVTGNLGVGTQNQQPIRNCFTLFDNLYPVKTNSVFSTVDNGTTEPDLWNVREVSNKVGTASIHGVDYGEGWALIAGEAGVYMFSGGDPVKISPEIDPLWKSISWKYGHTLWIRNDTNQRKIFVAVPIPTPNKWMPFFRTNPNPTQPNVVMMCSYKELMTAGALAGEGPIRVAYTGELKTFPLGRKWAAWSIEACYADFIKRADTTTPLFYCSDTGPQIYQQIANHYDDDGRAMHCFYMTYPFPKTREAEEMRMGLHQLLAHFMSMLITGEGNLITTIFPDTPDSPHQQTYPSLVLGDPPPWGDEELPLNETGNRFFVGLQVIQPDEHFELSRVIMAIGENPWAPVRGSNN